MLFSLKSFGGSEILSNFAAVFQESKRKDEKDLFVITVCADDGDGPGTGEGHAEGAGHRQLVFGGCCGAVSVGLGKGG